MKKSLVARSLYLTVALCSLFAAETALACQPNCADEIKVTSITAAGNSQNFLNPGQVILSSAQIAGNNLVAPNLSSNDFNTGGTGSFNTGNGMFWGMPGVGEYAPLANGKPGWILLGTETAQWQKGKKGKGYWEYSFTPAKIANQSIVGSNWFSAGGFGGSDNGGESGKWSFTLPSDLLDILQDNPTVAELFGDSLFDQFSLVLFGDTVKESEWVCVKYHKGVCKKWDLVETKETTPYIAYDFTAEDLGLEVSAETIYNFFGTWESCFDVTSIALYVRDPGTTNVPEPGSLALLGLGLTGFWLIRRRTRKQ